jgi:plasmid replication initiation protein
MGLTFEEEKEGRKVVAVKFRFKQTVVSQVVNEKTGKVTSIYEKPKAIALKKTKEVSDKYKKSSNTIEEQMSLDDPKSGLKPVKNIMLSLLDKFRSQK